MSFTFFTDRDLGRKFPAILRAAGLAVERHDDHFAPTTPDEEWITSVAARGWIALSHNERIRYTPNERDAVLRGRLGLLLVVGKAPFPELAANFVRSYDRIASFLDRHRPPFIAKVYRASPKELALNPDAPGRVELWFPRPK
ncbi:MAG: hypothetical protein ACR2H9_00720 [Longimicrobiaceae bacterium]